MKITETYKNNIKEIEKFIYTFNFPEESENKIRKYIENPLDVLNDNIKELFKKYDDQIVDFRIPLPTSMIRERRTIQKEIYLIMSLIVDCLEEDDQFKYSIDENGNIKADFQVNAITISNNYFKIKNDKRKVWRYLDSKTTNIAKKMYERWYEKKTFSWNPDTNETTEFIDINSNAIGIGPFTNVMDSYVRSLGSRNTSLKTKINKFLSRDNLINVTGMSHSEIINIIANEILKPIFNIIQEIISAKMLDLEKYKLYLSFNVFDWLLASTGESWHSCIDMQSNYGYGTGLLGMCGCPDWGMLLYTDGTEKEFAGIKSYHIVTRSWVCYTNQKDFQIINWYPKDMRSTVEFDSSEDFKFSFNRYDNARRSMSTWDPVVFRNGALAWIYSDSNRFIENETKDKVYFKFEDSQGLPRHVKLDGKILNDSCGAIDTVIRSITGNFHSIWDAVSHKYQINVIPGKVRETYTCDCCGDVVESEDDLTYIESEDISVCSSCLDNNFFWCESCEQYHRYDDDSQEIYNGSATWNYDLVCRSCFESLVDDGEVYWDEVADRYYRGSDSEILISTSGGEMTVSPYTINKLLEEHRIERDQSGCYHYITNAPEGGNE